MFVFFLIYMSCHSDGPSHMGHGITSQNNSVMFFETGTNNLSACCIIALNNINVTITVMKNNVFDCFWKSGRVMIFFPILKFICSCYKRALGSRFSAEWESEP